VKCLARPYGSLAAGSWFKLIGGASLQNLPTLSNLALVYTLAGADCIDVSADPAVIAAVGEAMVHGRRLAGFSPDAGPFLMVSLSDGDDPHFRKAHFDAERCPSDCPRPCLRICPVDAIAAGGIEALRCYGCGRCAPVCPLGLIEFRAWQPEVATIGALLADCPVDAVEIHTHRGNLAGFRRLWAGLVPVLPRLKLLAVSFPDEPGMREHLADLWEVMRAGPLSDAARSHIVWQIDGLPMSGDLARGTARASVRFAREVSTWRLPGYLQLAGGTNDASVALARAAGLAIGGIGYGSYARQLVQAQTETGPLAEEPERLCRAVEQARALVCQLKPHLQQEGAAPWLTTTPQLR
jgi:Fe-S-cluster-containing hydrogenase component 2